VDLPVLVRCANVNKSSLSRASKARRKLQEGIWSVRVGRLRRDAMSCHVLQIDGSLVTFNWKGSLPTWESSSREALPGASMLSRRESDKSCSPEWQSEMLLPCTGRARTRADKAVVRTRAPSNSPRSWRTPPSPKTTTTQSKREESTPRLREAALDATKTCWPPWPKHRLPLVKPLLARRPLKTRSSEERAANGATIPKYSASLRTLRRSNWKNSRPKWPTIAKLSACFRKIVYE